MAKKAARKKVAKALPQQPGSMTLANRLDTLLQTMRCIAQHEDELSTLLHDARNVNGITASLAHELRTILKDLPAEEYAWELHAVEMALDTTQQQIEAAA